VGASLKVLELLESGDDLGPGCARNGVVQGADAGPRLRHPAGDHPIVPVMIGDAARAAMLADLLLGKGVYVIGFTIRWCPWARADQDPGLGRPYQR